MFEDDACEAGFPENTVPYPIVLWHQKETLTF